MKSSAPPRSEDEVSCISVAEAFLLLLRRRGIDFLYINSGTDSAPLVEAYARQPQSGLDFPTPIIAPHENVAVSMAHGYTMATGRPQAIMVHVSVGAANAGCGLMNAARDNVPMLFVAGRTPLFEKHRAGSRDGNIHWAQELYDQAGMLRELVKWDYELRGAENVEQIVDRALAIAGSAPKGPVYLTLPREILAQRIDDFALRNHGYITATDPAPDPAAVQRFADLFARSRRPVLITTASGRDARATAALAEFAGRFGLGVVEFRSRYVCLPQNHPCHLGSDPHSALTEADLAIVAEAEVPWIPNFAEPRADLQVVHIGVDPLFTAYPVRSFRADLAINSSVFHLLQPLTVALSDRCDAASNAERKRNIADMANARRAVRQQRIAAAGGASRITKTWLNHCLNEEKPANAIVVNEYWADREILQFESPGDFFMHSPAAGLGWGLPAALGVAQAAADRPVIATLGDGAYIFANPSACHQLSAAYQLPLLIIVCNNGRWNAVQQSALSVYPGGHAFHHPTPAPLSDLSPSPDFEKYAQASGGYGARVSDPAELREAVRRALDILRTERRQVLLNVICE